MTVANDISGIQVPKDKIVTEDAIVYKYKDILRRSLLFRCLAEGNVLAVIVVCLSCILKLKIINQSEKYTSGSRGGGAHGAHPNGCGPMVF